MITLNFFSGEIRGATTSTEFTIELNKNTLPNSFQEYVLSTVYHEILNVIWKDILIKMVMEHIIPDLHEEIANKYVFLMTGALKVATKFRIQCLYAAPGFRSDVRSHRNSGNGKGQKTHRIKVHQLYIKPYVKQLSELFNDREEEVSLLHLLDEAYLAVRYENNYTIGEPDVLRLFEKADLLYVLAEQVYQRMMNNHFDQPA
ncbi:hypothetical protein [Pedobacter sp. P26]|uniref:hypothetical protein n=1 Tax=Pedobacter sp. P26 TaxID=3423956 RepID=UPI003D67F1E3